MIPDLARSTRRRAFVPSLALLLLAPLSQAVSAPLPSPEPPSHIPEVHVLSFSGDRVDLPLMLQGKVAILVLGFTKGARAQATHWGRRLPTDYLYATDVLYFEMPMLEAVPRLFRSTVLRSIKAEVSPISQPHFAPIITDEQRWRTLVHFNRPDDAYVLLVDSNGLVQGRFQGEPTDAGYQDLKRRVDQLLTSPAR